MRAVNPALNLTSFFWSWLETAMDLDTILDFPLPPEISRAVNPATNITSFFWLCLAPAVELDTVLDFSAPLPKNNVGAGAGQNKKKR